MSTGEIEIVFCAVAAVIFVYVLACAVAGFVEWLLSRGPSTEEREAVEDAPVCCLSYAARGEEHDVWCSRRPAVGRAAVVASDDLAWRADLDRFYRDYDRYRTEHRLPGERAS